MASRQTQLGVGFPNNVPVTSYQYDGNDNLTWRRDPAGNVATSTYDNLDRVASETTNAYLNPAQANEPVTRGYTYADANFAATGQVFDQTTDRNGRVRKVFYDGLDRAVKETWSDGRVMNFTYDNAGRLIGAGDPNTGDSYFYDALGRVVSYENYAAHEFDVFAGLYGTFDAAGNRTKLEAYDEGYGRDFTNTYFYDHLNRMKEVVQTGPSGPGSQLKGALFQYNLLGQPTAMTRYAGQASPAPTVATTQRLYGPAGDLRDVSHGSNGQSRGAYGYTRDANGRITSMNVDGQLRNFAHDDNAQLTTEPGKAYAYDENGNRTTTAQHQTGLDNRLIADDVYLYEYDGEGNRIKRTHRVGEQVTTYAYDHRNRLTAVNIGEATSNLVGEITPSTLSGDVSYFNNGQDVAAGTYVISFAGGAVDWTGAGGNDWTVNGHGGYYVYRVVSGSTEGAAPGTGSFFATAEAAESAGMGTSVTIAHAGGPLGVYMRDTDHSNNVVDGSVGAPRFRLGPGDLLDPVNERYAYDTSDRRVVKQVDANTDGDFTDAIDTTEKFVYDGDNIALVFDKSNAIQNRYLHGPGVDEVLAEDAYRTFSNTTTTVHLGGLSNTQLNGPRSVTRDANGTWVSADYTLSVYQYGGVWYAEVYDGANDNYIYFTNASTSTSPPTSGWAYSDDWYGMETGAQLTSIDATTGAGWRNHWLLGDHQNSVRQVIDDSGIVQNKLDYDAFGNVMSQTNAANAPRFGYTGRDWDRGTGLTYHRNNYLDPRSGTWLSPDPIMADANNGTRYVYNMPMDATDPYGLSASFGGNNGGFGSMLGGTGFSGASSSGNAFSYGTSYGDPFSLAPAPMAQATARETYMNSPARQAQIARWQNARASQGDRMPSLLGTMMPATASMIGERGPSGYAQFVHGSVNPLVETGLRTYAASTALLGAGQGAGLMLGAETAGGLLFGAGMTAYSLDNAQAIMRVERPYTAQGIGYLTGSDTAGDVGNIVAGVGFMAGGASFAPTGTRPPIVRDFVVNNARSGVLNLSVAAANPRSTLPLARPSHIRALAQVQLNASRGAAFEMMGVDQLRVYQNPVYTQVRVNPFLDDGSISDFSIRLDALTTGPAFEFKSSMFAPLTANQRVGFPLLGRNGGVINGNNGPGAGLVLPPTPVHTIRLDAPFP